jgi:hypothetical protein
LIDLPTIVEKAFAKTPIITTTNPIIIEVVRFRFSEGIKYSNAPPRAANTNMVCIRLGFSFIVKTAMMRTKIGVKLRRRLTVIAGR